MSVYRKNGKYYCRFQVDGERHHYLCDGATTINQARKIENAFMYKCQQKQNGIVETRENKILLCKLFDKFLEHSQLNKKSYKQDKSRVQILKKFFKGNKLAKDIKPDDIENLKSKLLMNGLAKSTINRYLEIMSKMFNIAISNDWLSNNPVKSNMKFPNKNYKVRYLTEEEEERLFKFLPKYLKELVFVALNTGLRAGNLLPLSWE